MKKVILIFLLTAFLMIGCASEPVAEDPPVVEEQQTTIAVTPEPTPTPTEIVEEASSINYQPYYDLIDDLAKGLKEGFTEEQTLLEDDGGLGVSYRFYAAQYNTYEVLGYMYIDLDSDGTDELLLGENSRDGSEGWDSIIYDIFTLKNGERIHVASGAERCRYYLCEDGTIAREGSSGAAYSSYEYFNYSDGGLSIIESYFSKQAANDEIKWFHSYEEAYMDDGTEIPKDEAMELIDSHVYRKLRFTWFEYVVE